MTKKEKALLEAAKSLRKYCQSFWGKENCMGCIFYHEDQYNHIRRCLLHSEYFPETWEIESIRDRMATNNNDARPKVKGFWGGYKEVIG